MERKNLLASELPDVVRFQLQVGWFFFCCFFFLVLKSANLYCNPKITA